MKRIVRLVLNILMAVVVVAAWLHMFFAGGGVLSHDGFSSMRFYTVLSNQLEGIASIIWIIAFAKSAVKIRKHESPVSKEAEPSRDKADGAEASQITIPEWVEILKYIGSVSVFLTFTIVIAFLGPLYGHQYMYDGANLWFHLIIPLIAVIEMMFLTDYKITKRANRLALYPTILYGVVYTGNNVINGIGTWPDGNDWYGFLNWGYPVGIAIFVCIGIGTWLLGRIIKIVNNRRLRD